MISRELQGMALDGFLRICRLDSMGEVFMRSTITIYGLEFRPGLERWVVAFTFMVEAPFINAHEWEPERVG